MNIVDELCNVVRDFERCTGQPAEVLYITKEDEARLLHVMQFHPRYQYDPQHTEIVTTNSVRCLTRLIGCRIKWDALQTRVSAQEWKQEHLCTPYGN